MLDKNNFKNKFTGLTARVFLFRNSPSAPLLKEREARRLSFIRGECVPSLKREGVGGELYQIRF
jgi:hypothetical protein